MDLLPPICNSDSHLGLCHYVGPLICFWIVEWHAPERVARQHGYRQEVPPPILPPLSDRLHDLVHDKKSEGTDWVTKHADYLAMWENREERCAEFQIGFTEGPWDHYLAWFNREGMRTVYWRGSTAQGLHTRLPSQPIHSAARTFEMRVEVVQRQVF